MENANSKIKNTENINDIWKAVIEFPKNDSKINNSVKLKKEVRQDMFRNEGYLKYGDKLELQQGSGEIDLSKYYDLKIYLSDLLLKAHYCNDIFHKSINDICDAFQEKYNITNSFGSDLPFFECKSFVNMTSASVFITCLF